MNKITIAAQHAHSIKIQDSAKGIRLSVLATCSEARQKAEKEEIPIAINGND